MPVHQQEAIRFFLLLSRIFLIGTGVSLLVFVATSHTARAEEVLSDKQETIPAVVTRVLKERSESIPGTALSVTVQTVEAMAKDGIILTFEHDLTPLLEPGEKLFLKRTTTHDGSVYVTFQDRDRRAVLATFLLLFVGMLILILGKRSWRTMLALTLSLLAVFFLLVPALSAGYPAIPVTIAIAGSVLAFAIFLIHGRSSHGVIAFLGTLGAVLVSTMLAIVAVSSAGFSGTGSDASVYLNISTRGTLDLPALLLASMIIGILGILDDVAVTQASVTEELARANPAYGFLDLFRGAMRVGRDHTSSLVNTLAFAYVGAALPLVLLMSLMETPLTHLINQEIVSDEIMRILVGSIGLMFAVPFTTAIAAYWYGRKVPIG